MAQKNATPTSDQKKSLLRNGLRPELWVVVKDLHNSMIVKNRFTGEFKLIEK